MGSDFPALPLALGELWVQLVEFVVFLFLNSIKSLSWNLLRFGVALAPETFF